MSVFVTAVGATALGSLYLTVPDEYRSSPEEPLLIQFHETIWELPLACNLFLDNKTLYACHVPETKTTHLPNPCYYPEAKQVGSFAHLACHENGHVNGWRH